MQGLDLGLEDIFTGGLTTINKAAYVGLNSPYASPILTAFSIIPSPIQPAAAAASKAKALYDAGKTVYEVSRGPDTSSAFPAFPGKKRKTPLPAPPPIEYPWAAWGGIVLLTTGAVVWLIIRKRKRGR